MGKNLGELKGLLEQLPRLDKEAEAFEKDVEDIRVKQPTLLAQDFQKR